MDAQQTKVASEKVTEIDDLLQDQAHETDVVVAGSGRKQIPPLHPIPVQRPFQIFSVDIMELPTTECGNRYIVCDSFSRFLDEVAIGLPCTRPKSH